jgi:AcrR family transcriptional regulator
MFPGMVEGRRQQSERTAATRKAVLEATLELLVERGYGGTSTRLAAERAGVSLGALQHHFRTKADLSVEALGYASERLAEEFIATSTATGDLLDRFGSILDRLFVVFRGSTFVAAVEIHLASRTDPDLQPVVLSLDREIEALILASAGGLLPEICEDPEFDALIWTSVSAVRGLALTAMTPQRDGDAEWRQVRDQLIQLASRITQREIA